MDRVLTDVGGLVGVPRGALRVQRLDGGRQNQVFRVCTPGCEPAILRIVSASHGQGNRDALCAYLHRDFQSSPVHGDAVSAFVEAGGTGPIAFGIGASILHCGVFDGDGGLLHWSLSEDLRGWALWKDDLGEAACRAVARALVSLHSVVFAEMLPDLSCPNARLETRQWLRAYITALRNDEVAPVVGSATIDRLLDAADDIAGTLVLTHGDLHGGNVFIGAQGARLIDWDEAAVAHCERDLVFVAHSLEGMTTPERARALYDAFEREYARQAPGRISPARMAFYTSLHLLERVNVFAGARSAHLANYAGRLEQQVAMLSR